MKRRGSLEAYRHLLGRRGTSAEFVRLPIPWEFDKSMAGYLGKILFVNLSNRDIRAENPSDSLYREFLGGQGLGARVLYSRQKPGVDPLGPDSTLGLLTGVLVGTPALFACRYIVVGKSPLTGGWGDSNSGGDFGPYMKFAGIDGVFFSGISDTPVYLLVENGKAQLQDACHLWGKDTYETETILQQELGSETRVACIGPSGEKLSRISGIICNHGRAAARAGLGAVMGSKKLKAVALRGFQPFPIFDKAGIDAVRKKYLPMMQNLRIFQKMKKYGTGNDAYTAPQQGTAPIKNWAGSFPADYPDPEPLKGDYLLQKYEKRYGCWHCPMPCSGRLKAGTGEYQYESGSRRPEFETLTVFGPMLLNNNLEAIIKANDICDRYGLDTISTGTTIAFAIECFEKGFLTGTDTDGLELTWGNHRAIVALTEKIAKREGIGDLLADGCKRAAERIGRGTEQFAMHVGGQEIPVQDPRQQFARVGTFIVDAQPGRHTRGSYRHDVLGMNNPTFSNDHLGGRGEAHKRAYLAQHATSSAGICYFGWQPTHVDAWAPFFQMACGWHDFTWEEMLKSGERIANIRMAFTIREGLTMDQWKFPERVLKPLAGGPTAGVGIEEIHHILIRDFLRALDWDDQGRPSKAKLRELGLDDVARDLHP